jgi:hypothetical protein
VIPLSAAQHLDLAQSASSRDSTESNLNNLLLHPQQAHNRQVEVLRNMVEQGYITRSRPTRRRNRSPDFFKPQPAPKNLAPHCQLYRDQLDRWWRLVNSAISRSASTSTRRWTSICRITGAGRHQAHLYGDDRDDYVGHHFIRDDHLTNSAAIIADHHTGAYQGYAG